MLLFVSEAAAGMLSLAQSSEVAAPRWVLPKHGVLPEPLAANLVVAAGLGDGLEDNSQQGISVNVKAVEWGDVKEQSFILIPLRGPIGEEAMCFDFLGGCGLAAFLVRGKPGPTTTFVAFMGVIGEGPVVPFATGALFALSTPGVFLTAAAEILEFCEQMRDGAVAAKRGARDVQQAEDRLDKRRRGPAQAEGGVLASSEEEKGERMAGFLNDLDGRHHFTRVRLDLASREQDLAIAFRAVEKERWLYLMGSECILQLGEYRSMIVEQYETRPSERDAAFAGCGMLDRIRTLGFGDCTILLGKLLMGKFGSEGDKDSLRIRDFVEVGGHLPTESTPDLGHNRVLVRALENLEVVLVVFLAPAFAGSLAAFRDCLEGIVRPLELAPADFLLYSVEMTLTKYFRMLRTGSRVGTDLSNPEGCAEYLRESFARLVADIAPPVQRGEAVLRYRLMVRREKVVHPVPPPRIKTVPMAAAPPRGEKATPPVFVKAEIGTVCAGHLGNVLGLTNPKTGKRYVCPKPPGGCSFIHKDATGISKREIRTLAEGFPLGIREPFLTSLLGPRAK